MSAFGWSVVKLIWEQSTGRYVYLPWVERGSWRESAALEPYSVPMPAGGMQDQYFTPLRFNGSKRRRENVGRPGVIFADLDGNLNDVYTKRLQPNVVIETSPNHGHAYWFLHGPVDPDRWEGHARGWSQELQADPGGWDVTQVLRVPGTVNAKPGKGNMVKVVSVNPDRRYDLSDFPYAPVRGIVSASSIPQHDPMLRQLLMDDSRMTMSMRYFLTESAPVRDRSAFMWKVYMELFDAGFDEHQVYALVRPVSWNKHIGNDDKLWREIVKARQHKEST